MPGICRLGVLIAVSVLVATPVWAQPATSSPSTVDNSPSAGTAIPLLGPTSARAAAGRLQKSHGGWRSSQLVGATVYNDRDQSIGTIDDLIVGQDGRVSDAVISVGGFLGIGSKLIRVAYKHLRFQQVHPPAAPLGSAAGPAPPGSTPGAIPAGADARSMPVTRIVLPGATRDSLKSMQSFTYAG